MNRSMPLGLLPKLPPTRGIDVLLAPERIENVKAWMPEAKQALKDGVFTPPLPTIASKSALNNYVHPTTLYNAMVHPLVPYANRGFLWYQGESNRGEGMLYRDKMEALINGWRGRWNQDDLTGRFNYTRGLNKCHYIPGLSLYHGHRG